MTSTRRTLATSLALAGALICAGCTQSAATPAETTTTTTTSTPPPTTTSPPPLTPEQQDEKDAEQAVVNLIDLTNKVGIDTNVKLEDLAAVARGTSLNFWQESTFRQRAAGEVQTGEASVTPSQVEYENNNIYKVTACLDVSKIDIRDAQGQSIVSADRDPRVEYVYTVEKAPEGFFVTDEMASGPC